MDAEVKPADAIERALGAFEVWWNTEGDSRIHTHEPCEMCEVTLHQTPLMQVLPAALRAVQAAKEVLAKINIPGTCPLCGQWTEYGREVEEHADFCAVPALDAAIAEVERRAGGGADAPEQPGGTA